MELSAFKQVEKIIKEGIFKVGKINQQAYPKVDFVVYGAACCDKNYHKLYIIISLFESPMFLAFW